MKHNFKDGKWMPEDRTFVHVPNEQIKEVIQLLRDNGQAVWECEESAFEGDEDAICFDKGEWNSACVHLINGPNSNFNGIELPFPDFKALVTGKLPESWCIQCTEESMKHEAFENLCMVLGLSSDSEFEGKYYGIDKAPRAASKPFGEVLQIETWAALNDLMPQKCKGCNGAGELSKPPFDDSEECPFCKGSGLDESLSELEEVLSDPEIRNHPDNNKRILLPKSFGQKEIHLSVDKAIISDLETTDLINELKSRGYTVRKIY